MQGQAGEPRPQLPEMIVTFPCLVPSHHKPLTPSQIPGFNIQITCPRSPLAAGRDTKSLVTPHVWLLVWRLCLCTHISDVHQLQKSSWNHPFILSCNNLFIGQQLRVRSYSRCWSYTMEQKYSWVLGIYGPEQTQKVLALRQALSTLWVRACHWSQQPRRISVPIIRLTVQMWKLRPRKIKRLCTMSQAVCFYPPPWIPW